MGSTRARTPKNFVLDERLERYRDAIEYLPATWAGRWREAAAPLAPDGRGRFSRLCLDLGCGKGSYLVAAARQEPDTLFIGVDVQPVCIAYAAQRICEAGVDNALVVPGSGERLAHMFAPGELDKITLNFPTPHPRKREALERLTTVDHLVSYRGLLARGGEVVLRTDSEPLHDYSLPQFVAAGYEVVWDSGDTRAEHPEIPLSEYEERLVEEGATVHGICAVPGPEPTDEQLRAGRAKAGDSLYDYIPDDLYEGSYVPHGMGFAITAFRNRRRNLAARERAAGAREAAADPAGKEV
ncbi:MAG: methyltransferase domain-containing protein [Collinsella sp.]|nr:methyltransferase domain-containing protein [Collinsella sp.]